ncbi:hypothetical protein SAMN05444682_11712 [Parapedobacter indicus]|uniref:Uncharacterized protein n=1 Tax=Parapedobacter indicus TaxID=1477437 RepID=A0A1I3VH72_9SPHI|nr:hypothetical protein CLV26_11736 [Parapedobacter indicus]SFJ94718.1 hypothetical protein SAMN05444682_11712 [Parapedobacter indicus]
MKFLSPFRPSKKITMAVLTGLVYAVKLIQMNGTRILFLPTYAGIAQSIY